MTDKELKRMSRAALLELLIEQMEENEKLKAELSTGTVKQQGDPNCRSRFYCGGSIKTEWCFCCSRKCGKTVCGKCAGSQRKSKRVVSSHGAAG